MEKKFTKIEIAAIKRTAQNVAQFVVKKERIAAQIKDVEEKVAEQIRKRVSEKIEKLEAEMANYQSIIDAFQGPIKDMTGGYTTEDLIQREVVKTGKLDPKTGKEIMQIRYTLKYPETVIPSVDVIVPAEPAEDSDDEEAAENDAPLYEQREEDEMPEEDDNYDDFPPHSDNTDDDFWG